MRLVIGRRAGELGRPRHRRQQFDLRDRLAGRLVGHALDALAPLRQRRHHRIALHRIGHGFADLGLRLGHVVHEVAAHNSHPIVIVAAEFHECLLGLSFPKASGQSMAPEQLVIGLLPFPLIVAAEHHRHDLSLFEHLADFWRIGRDIRPGRQAPLAGHERLAFLA